MTSTVRITLTVLALTCMPPTAVAQTAPITLTGPALSGEWAMEQQTRERWMHGGQQSRFTPFLWNRQWMMVDSIRAAGAGRRLYLTLGRTVSGRDSAVIVVGPRGQVARLDAGQARYSRQRVAMPGDSLWWVNTRRRTTEDGISLLASRLWDLVPSAPPGALRAGVVWTDTIAHTADDEAFHQRMRGTRVSRVMRDSTVAGRRLWLVHDSAVVAYDERYPEQERTLDTTVAIARVMKGTVRGTHLYDPALGLFHSRSDTTRLSGDASLRYAARMAELRGGMARASGGMVMVPTNRIEQRLADGDVKVRDSLLLAWQHMSDPDSAAAIFEVLSQWGTTDAWSAARLDSIRVAAGDTAHLYQLLARRAFSREPLDSADMRAMLRFMDDPSRAWRYNLSRDLLYENLAQALTTWPRAAAAPDPARSSVACTLPACRLLGEQWRTAHEPRLRDVGLLALLSVDPAHWADTVLALAGPRHPLLGSAVLLVHGVGATWPAASQAHLPPPDSDWHAWLEWMDGRNPEYTRQAAERTLPAAFRRDTVAHVRFEESHATAVRFFQARTGRDIVGEWRRAYDATRSDSARLVFGTMLEGLGELRLTEADVFEGFTSGNAARVAFARRALPAHAEWTPLDTVAAIPLLERLLAATVDSGPLWPTGVEGIFPAPRGHPTVLHARRTAVFLNPAGLPSAILAEWGSRAHLLTQADWNTRDVRLAGVHYTIDTPQHWGRFVRIGVSASERTARAPNEVPSVNASAVTYWLMPLNGDWVIVGMESWVT